jgi:hypothetical protein
MKTNLIYLFGVLLGPYSAAAAAPPGALTLQVGMLLKVNCKGRLQVSAVGDDRRLQVEALPKQLGCAVILKPLRPGRTNLILETSAESLMRNVVIKAGSEPKPPEFKSHAPKEEEKSR